MTHQDRDQALPPMPAGVITQYTRRDNHNQPIVNQPRSQASAQDLCNQTKANNHAALARIARGYILQNTSSTVRVPLLALKFSLKDGESALSCVLESRLHIFTLLIPIRSPLIE